METISLVIKLTDGNLYELKKATYLGTNYLLFNRVLSNGVSELSRIKLGPNFTLTPSGGLLGDEVFGLGLTFYATAFNITDENVLQELAINDPVGGIPYKLATLIANFLGYQAEDLT
jgi:hypothetical protein